MKTLRITRLVGFGSKPPQDFDQFPVTLGTASSATIRFDAVLDRCVAPQHARIEWNGEALYLLDAGSLEGTWVDGGRLTEAYPIYELTELSLGEKGPKLRIEPLASTQAAAAELPVPAAQVSGSREQAHAFSSESLPKWALAAGAIVILAVVAGCWFLISSGDDDSPSFAPVLDTPVDAPFSEGVSAQVVALPSEKSAKAAAPAPVDRMRDVIPEELKPMVKVLKRSPWQLALREFWEETDSRSPYARAILANEDLWLAKQIPWMESLFESGGVSTGRGMDYPGVFVPETIYPDTVWLGLPLATPDVSSAVGEAVVENAPIVDTSNIASMTNMTSGAPGARRLPSQIALRDQFRSYASTGLSAVRDESAPQAYAFFVGINRFEDSRANLAGCRNDVGALAKVLTSQGIFQPETLKIMTDARKGTPDYPNKENVVQSLNRLVEAAGENDVIFLGFSTHGAFDREKKDSYLLLADMTHLYGQELMQILAKAKAKNIVITMDACQTGGMPGIGANQYSGEGRSVAPIPESFYEMLGSSRGHVVIRACRADQTTPDIRTLGHGILTTALVAGLTGDADSNNDGIVTLSELRIYVTTAIPRISKRANEISGKEGQDPLEPTFTSGSFGEAGDLPLTVVERQAP